MTRATFLIVCLATSAWPAGAQGPTAESGAPTAPNASQTANRTAWRVPARLVARTGGDHLEEPKGFLASDPVAGRIRFEADHPGAFDVGYDQITSVHHEHGAKHPDRLFNRHVEFYLTIRHADDSGGQRVSTLRLDESAVSSTLDRLEADAGLTIDRTEAKRSFLGLPIRVTIGDSVSITDVTGQQVKGTITALSDSSLAVDGPGGATRVFDEASVARIRRRYEPGHAALVGFVAGAATGGGVGAMLSAGLCGCGAEELPSILLFAAGMGVSVAGLSVALGAISHPRSKSPDVYVGPGGAARSPAAVTVGPLLTRQRRGVAVSLTF